MSESLAGKVLLVTGGAGGQGSAIARRTVAEGGRVVVTDIADDAASELLAEIGESACYAHLDVADENEWESAVATAIRTFGRIDALVNNAGMGGFKPIVATSAEHFLKVTGVNQLGAFLGMRAVIPSMAESGGGSIINISTTAALSGMAGGVAYCGSKWALRGMSKSAAAELAKLEIRVNTILPGVIDTPLTRYAGAPDDITSGYPPVPLERPGMPDELAAMCVYLASDASSYVTGADFVLDGGQSASMSAPTDSYFRDPQRWIHKRPDQHR